MTDPCPYHTKCQCQWIAHSQSKCQCRFPYKCLCLCRCRSTSPFHCKPSRPTFHSTSPWDGPLAAETTWKTQLPLYGSCPLQEKRTASHRPSLPIPGHLPSPCLVSRHLSHRNMCLCNPPAAKRLPVPQSASLRPCPQPPTKTLPSPRHYSSCLLHSPWPRPLHPVSPQEDWPASEPTVTPLKAAGAPKAPPQGHALPASAKNWMSATGRQVGCWRMRRSKKIQGTTNAAKPCTCPGRVNSYDRHGTGSAPMSATSWTCGTPLRKNTEDNPCPQYTDQWQQAATNKTKP